MIRDRRWAALVLVPMAMVGALVASTPVDAVAAAAPSSTVFSYHANSRFNVDLKADMVPSVDCVYHAKNSTTSTYWFGYSLTNDQGVHDLPVPLSVGPYNSFEELNSSGTVVNATANRGQTTYFQTGTHQYAFGVAVATGHALRWTVAAPDPATNPDLGYWVAQITTLSPPACPKGVKGLKAQSAAPQSLGSDGIRVAPVKETRSKGLLKTSQIEFSVTGVTSACSAGGSPLPPRVLWGFHDFTRTASINFAPVKGIVRTDIFSASGASTSYARTWKGTRKISNPQLPYTTAAGISSHGLASTYVLADVYARCSFPNGSHAKIVQSRSALWIPPSGGPGRYSFVTDAATQTTRLVDCDNAETCEVDFGDPGGGTKYR